MDNDDLERLLGDRIADFSDDNDEIESDIYGKFYTIMYKRDKALNKDEQVVIKIYDKDKMDEKNKDKIISQIKKEIDMFQKLKHEQILELIDSFETPNSIVLIFENFECSLQYYIYNEGPFEDERELFESVTHQICNVFYYLHKNNITYRDIKPSNIFITRDRAGNLTAKIGDFYSATYDKENKERVGTYEFMAPEIIKGDIYDNRCDIWSLGVFLIQIYKGVSPLGSELNKNKIREIFHERKELYFSTTRNKNLDIIIRMMLQIDPNKRIKFDELMELVEGNFLNKNFGEKYDKYYEQIKDNLKDAIFSELEEIKETNIHKKLK